MSRERLFSGTTNVIEIVESAAEVLGYEFA